MFVRGCALADALIELRAQVGREVVEHDRDPGLQRVQRAHVAQESEELAAALARLDVAVELVGAQIERGEQVAHALGAAEGHAQAPA